jgi:hypothetical protein
LAAFCSTFATSPPINFPTRGVAERMVFHLLLGAAFSLWRAAFLVEGEREHTLISQHGTDFLDTLLWDNAINFPQDRRTHAFSGGYYLNNAAIRLVRVRDHLILDAHCQPLFERLDTFLDSQWHAPGLVPDLRDGWDTSHMAGVAGLEHLRRGSVLPL